MLEVMFMDYLWKVLDGIKIVKLFKIRIQKYYLAKFQIFGLFPLKSIRKNKSTLIVVLFTKLQLEQEL